MKHYMHLKESPFQKIWNGEKTIELRLYDEKRRRIKVNDEIEFSNLNDSTQLITVKVVSLHLFENFAELYTGLPLNKCGYTDETVKLAKPDDMNAYYSVEEQSRYGVVGIEFIIKHKG